MRVARSVFISVFAMSCAAAFAPADAQMQVYKCGYRSYSEAPCSRHVVNTKDAPVPSSKSDPNLMLAQSLRKLPGESGSEFAMRRHRARMLETDRDECARLDTRIPFEQERLKSPHAQEVEDAQSALVTSKKRFRELRC